MNLKRKNKSEMKKIIHITAVFFYLFLIVALSGKLFFEKEFDGFLSRVRSGFSHEETKDVLVIGLPDQALSLSPLVNDTGSRARLLHIYEGLLRVNADLKIEPALVVSYGVLNDMTWEFKLRPDVYFHDGSPLTMEDVIFSLETAKNDPLSGVADLSSTISGIEKISDNVLHIKTISPDPLLPQKLAGLFIFSKNAGVENPVGTGPYAFSKNSGGQMELTRFESYWGDKPFFEGVILKTVSDKAGKIKSLQNKEVDLLANLPADIAADFNFAGFKLHTYPSLEVNFLMFNFDGVFSDKNLRKAAALALKKDQLSRLAYGFAVIAEQFVGNGILGYDPEIKKFGHDLEKAKELVQSTGGVNAEINFDLPKGLEVFGGQVKNQLDKAGFEVTPNYSSPSQLSAKILKGTSPFYFFGWRSEMGDSSDFLAAVAHSRTGAYGYFNGGNYKNEEVDKLIELSQKTLKPKERLSLLRGAMRKITAEDIIGVPLFSPEVLYGVAKNLKWRPRVDGYVLAQDIKM